MAKLQLKIDLGIPNSSSSNYYAILSHPELNKLYFPKISEPYSFFNMADMEEIDQILGGKKGSHPVKAYLHIPTNTKMAVKFVQLKYSQYQDDEKEYSMLQLLREYETHRTLSNHPNIVGLFGICVHEGSILICMEIMTCSLEDVLEMGGLSEQNIGCIGVSVVNALRACKEQNIIHRDVKPGNILLDQEGNVKLSDFGLSRKLKDSIATTYVGTRIYLPPERFQMVSNMDQEAKKTYDIRSDVWSLGITLIELCNGFHPFYDKIKDGKICMVTITERISKIPRPNADPKKFSKRTRNFIETCLQDVDQRPTFEGLTNTAFYQFYATFHDKSSIIELVQDFLKFKR